MLEDGRWDALRAALGTRREALVRLAGLIHSCPELGGQEVKAAGWLVEFLAGEGFSVHRTVAGMDTAFRADWSRDGPKPAVIFLAEYDALPELGHACGHNLIAAAAAGAGAVLRQVMNEAGLTGTITVLGTPAEETAGGKIDLLKAGVFADGDAALMMHPATASSVGGKSLALIPVRFTFRGRAAHAAASPQDGINALEAVIQTFNGVNALRQHLPEDVRVHGIVTRGGLAPNVVPDLAEAYFYVRAATMAGARVVLRRLTGCARAGALRPGHPSEWRKKRPSVKSCPILPWNAAWKHSWPGRGWNAGPLAACGHPPTSATSPMLSRPPPSPWLLRPRELPCTARSSPKRRPHRGVSGPPWMAP
ncbi:MAG: M20 family metallopeptidase [bacterium]|nr:M20 family metallopeptidase [bacterium]